MERDEADEGACLTSRPSYLNIVRSKVPAGRRVTDDSGGAFKECLAGAASGAAFSRADDLPR